MKIIILFSLVSLFCVSGLAEIYAPEETKTTFTYKVDIPRPTGKFSKMKIWIPMPTDSNDQKINSAKISTPLKYEINSEDKFGNKMLFAEVDSPEKLPATIEVKYEVDRKAALPLTMDKIKNSQYWAPEDFVGTYKKIPLDGKIAALAKDQTKNLKSDTEKIRGIYKYVTDSMTYNKDGTGWGQGDAVWACDSKRGNCTDFHSLLIGMARSQKIPARYEMGFPIPPAKDGIIPGYHCWAWVFSSDEHDWLPLDSSEAKNNGKLFEYLGHLPSDRIQFTNGRDIVLSPKQDGDPLNYFIYPYVEIDGKASTDFKKEFSFKKI